MAKLSPKFGEINMSKIGKLAIDLPESVEADIKGHLIKISGPKGSLALNFSDRLSIEKKDGKLKVVSQSNAKPDRAKFGTTRALVSNMVTGVQKGWEKRLELVGTGFRAEVNGKTLILTVGYSHPVKIIAPEGIDFKVEKTIIIVLGIDKELVGQIAAYVRAVRPPEPYKGKGIKYIDEVIRRKPGKAAKTVGAAG